MSLQNFIGDFLESVYNVHAVMVKLRELKDCGKIRELTDLNPALRNLTRWSYTFQMLERYLVFNSHLEKLDVPKNNSPLFSTAENESMSNIMEYITILESVKKMLQTRGTNIEDVRDLFNAVIENTHPWMAICLQRLR